MKEEGIHRLEGFKINIASLKKDYLVWGSEEAEREYPNDPQQRESYFNDISRKLSNAWNTILKRVEEAISTKDFLPLLEDIILFLENPVKIELFFGTLPKAMVEVLILPELIKMKMQHHLVKAVFDLFIGCQSATDFFDDSKLLSKSAQELFKWTSEIIVKINREAELKGILLEGHAKQILEISSISGDNEYIRDLSRSMASAVSLQSMEDEEDIFAKMLNAGLDSLSKISDWEIKQRGATNTVAPDPDEDVRSSYSYESSYFLKENEITQATRKGIYSQKRTPLRRSPSASPITFRRTGYPKEEIIGGNIHTSVRYEIIINIQKPSLSPETREEMRKKREFRGMAEWMQDGFSLNKEVYDLVVKHRDKLKIELANNPPTDTGADKRQIKFNFLEEVIKKSDIQSLSPKLLHALSQDKFGLLFKAFAKSYTQELWLKMRKDLKNELWEKGMQLADDPSRPLERSSLFSITDLTLINRLYNKLKSISKPDDFDHSALAEDDRVKWRHDKYKVLEKIIYDHEHSRLGPKEFKSMRDEFKHFSKRSFSWIKSSEVEKLFNEIEEEVKQLLWIEASGEGDTIRREFKLKQGVKAMPNPPINPDNYTY